MVFGIPGKETASAALLFFGSTTVALPLMPSGCPVKLVHLLSTPTVVALIRV